MRLENAVHLEFRHVSYHSPARVVMEDGGAQEGKGVGTIFGVELGKQTNCNSVGMP